MVRVRREAAAADTLPLKCGLTERASEPFPVPFGNRDLYVRRCGAAAGGREREGEGKRERERERGAAAMRLTNIICIPQSSADEEDEDDVDWTPPPLRRPRASVHPPFSR